MANVELSNGTMFFQTTSPAAAKGSLIFIHGAGGTHTKWVKQMEAGINGWSLAAVDLLGHGASSGSPSPEVHGYADTMKDFLEKSDLPRPWLLAGHSMGASIALQAAVSYPEIVDGLVLIGSGARMPVNANMLEQLAQGTFDTAFLKIAYSRDVAPDLLQAELDGWTKVPQQQLYIDFMACDQYDLSEQLSSLTIPVLILVGDQDKMTPVKSAEYLHQNIAGSKLIITPGSGHHLMMEKSEETNLAIKDFLNNKFA